MRHYAGRRRRRGSKPTARRSPMPIEEAEQLILARLAAAFPGMPVVAEEEAAAGRIAQTGRHFFLVDPLDGTREFLSRNGEFTVNIAEVVGRRARGRRGLCPGGGAAVLWRCGRRLRTGAGSRTATPISHRRRAIRARRPAAGWPGGGGQPLPCRCRDRRIISKPLPSAGNSQRRFVAEILPGGGGRSRHLCPRRPHHGVGLAAGHAVLAAAGGSVTNWDGTPFLYGKPGFENPAFVARGLPEREEFWS